MRKILLPLLIIIILLLSVLLFFNQHDTTNTSTPESEITPTGTISSDTPLECSGEVIPALTEGPYYTPNSPEKTVLLEDGVLGTKLTLTGYVVDTTCQPLANAWLDFWQADGEGEYDNESYVLRGHQFTDENGRYSLTTVIPGEYPGRTLHIHVKVRATEESPILTTQLFVPGIASNEEDAIYDDALLMDISGANDEKTATFTFVISPN